MSDVTAGIVTSCTVWFDLKCRYHKFDGVQYNILYSILNL